MSIRRATLLEAADLIEKRGHGAARIIRFPGQSSLCQQPSHDDRWCTDCDRMEMGMNLAAQMLRDLAAGTPGSS